MNGYSRRAKPALILSPDPLGAALIGAATELAGCRAVYPEEGESVPDSIRRLKPVAVLVDATHPILAEPASLGPALMTGASVVFFGSAVGLRDVRVLAAASKAATIALPEEIDRLAEVLTGAMTRQPGRARSQ